MNSGTSSDGYAESVWDCSTLVAEVPLLHGAQDRRQGAGAGCRDAKPSCAASSLNASYAGGSTSATCEAASKLTGESPWQRSCYGYLESAADDLRAEQRQTEHEPAFDAEATVAELLDSVYSAASWLRCSRCGRLVQMVAAEPEQDASLAALTQEAEAKVRDRAPPAGLGAARLQPVPIRGARAVPARRAVVLAGRPCRDRYRPRAPGAAASARRR